MQRLNDFIRETENFGPHRDKREKEEYNLLNLLANYKPQRCRGAGKYKSIVDSQKSQA
jgi:hypothetical protein